MRGRQLEIGTFRRLGARKPWLVLATLLAATPVLAMNLSARLDERNLEELRRTSRDLRQAAQPSERSGSWQDIRCVFHAHSELSHDSRGTLPEIVDAAKKAGVRAVFMSEHPTPEHQWLKQGPHGEQDGVLFVPGAELSDGLLIWRDANPRWKPDMKAGPVLEMLKDSQAVTFICHPEQRRTDADWDLPPFVGMEIYNTHADAEDNGFDDLLTQVRNENPLKLLQMLGSLRKFRREAFAAIFDEQAEILKRWDTLNQKYLPTGRRVVGIAGNDSHQNIGFSFEKADGNVEIKDALGKRLGALPGNRLPVFLLGNPGGGNQLLAHTFDPYEISFRYVSTHVLASEATEAALFDAVRQGRAYIAFDWMADPSGFRYYATASGRTVDMGGTARTTDGPVLTVKPNMACQIRLLRNGIEVQRVEGTELTFDAREPGVYRAEAWVPVGGGMRPWVYTNPIYIQAAP